MRFKYDVSTARSSYLNRSEPTQEHSFQEVPESIMNRRWGLVTLVHAGKWRNDKQINALESYALCLASRHMLRDTGSHGKHLLSIIDSMVCSCVRTEFLH
eukprot:2615630-Amphidinium_carterae.1